MTQCIAPCNMDASTSVLSSRGRAQVCPPIRVNDPVCKPVPDSDCASTAHQKYYKNPIVYASASHLQFAQQPYQFILFLCRQHAADCLFGFRDCFFRLVTDAQSFGRQHEDL